jgi:uncharacterized Zn-finger protein
MTIHTGDNRHKNEVCDKAISQQIHLIMHLAIYTGVKKRKFEVCDKAFSKQSHLITHMTIQTGDKNVKRVIMCFLNNTISHRSNCDRWKFRVCSYV